MPNYKGISTIRKVTYRDMVVVGAKRIRNQSISLVSFICAATTSVSIVSDRIELQLQMVLQLRLGLNRNYN